MSKNNNIAKNLYNNFYSGNYEFIIQSLEVTPKNKMHDLDSVSLGLYIGSLIFTGQIKEAEIIYQEIDKKKLSLLLFCRFYFTIGYIRLSLYEKAKNLAHDNLALLNSPKLKSEDLFYIYQTLAFYRFTFGSFLKAKRWADKAYQYAFQGKFTYGLGLSTDLIGHCLVQIGLIHKGLSTLEKSYNFFNSIQYGGNATAVQISIIIYRAQYGIDLLTSESQIQKALKKLAPTDTYSKGELILEYARQMLIRGQAQKAQHLLDENSNEIYRFENKYQAGLFNFRYATILFYKGEYHAALTLLRAAKVNLNPNVDFQILRQIEGLEWKISALLNPNLSSNLFTKKPISYFDERIQNRMNPSTNKIFNKGEDFIGDWIDSLKAFDIDKIKEITKNRLFGFIPLLLKIKNSDSVIFLGPNRGQALLYSKGDALFVPSGFTSTMYKLLSVIKTNKGISKEKIIETVWGYQYRPDVHDKILHTTISKIRKLMGPFHFWIEWKEGSYLLNQFVDLKTRDYLTAVSPKNSLSEVNSQDHKTLSEGQFSKIENTSIIENQKILNYRQIKLLQKMSKESVTDVSDYSNQFKVSKITACRDLTELTKLKKLIKLGNARATKYIKNEN